MISPLRQRLLLLCALLLVAACQSDSRIIVLGDDHRTHANTVTFRDEGGYDGHQETCHFQPSQVLPSRPVEGCNIPKRYSVRGVKGLPEAVAAAIANSGYDMNALRERVDQVVLHFDVCGCSKQCFKVLHDVRGLSCHFLLDLDGTIYQTLDLEHRARHATKANDRSIGIEIAHMGAYADPEMLKTWYQPDERGRVVFRLPKALGDGGVRTPDFVARPAREGIFEGVVNGQRLYQYDFTEEQYQSLEALLPALASIFPRIAPVVPRDESGQPTFEVMEPKVFDEFQGVLGHYHVQRNKSDPGPAMDWERIAQSLERQ